jgi:hypothetical protein
MSGSRTRTWSSDATAVGTTVTSVDAVGTAFAAEPRTASAEPVATADVGTSASGTAARLGLTAAASSLSDTV